MEQAQQEKKETLVKEDQEQSTKPEDTVALGGNIELSGFSSLDGGSMVILKKIVGSYARKFADSGKGFEKLGLHMKVVHKKEKSEKYEIKGYLIMSGKRHTSELTDRNLFFVVDKIMKNLEKISG